MKCARCGSELAANDQFCGECGAPRPAPAAVRVAQPRPIHRSRRSWCGPVIIGGTLLVAFAAILIGLRWLLPPSQLGLSRGGGSDLSATFPPTSAPPGQTPAPTAATRPTLAPGPTAEVDPELTPVPADGRIVFKDAAVNFTLPADWAYKTIGDMLWIRSAADGGRRGLLTVDSFQPVSGSPAAADELRYWLNVHDDVTWTPFTTEQTAVGELVWSTGESTSVMPIYAAIQGPLKDGQILYWWGQAPDRQWAATLPLFKQISRSTTAAQP